MKYLLAIVTSLALMTPVYAQNTPNTPVKKGNLMLAKKKDHSKAQEKPAKKSEKKSKK